MKKFKVLVRGKNYLIRAAENPPRKVGFYTTAFVEASNTEQAEAAAVELLRNDLNLRSASENKAPDPPKLQIESIEETQSFDGCNLPRTGLAIYEEES
ncbi:MAG TPA: hypothetical protein VMB80_13545 [Candidatus Acidoferrum sp.]|nr:hypothetical protein [Candidatus Acidoferrum sp.]